MIGMPDANFMEKLHFGPVDLEHNRRGELSPQQLERLKVERDFNAYAAAQPAGSSNVVLLFFIVMLLGIFGFMWVMAGEQFRQLFESLGPAALPLGAGAVVLLVLYLWYARRSIQDSQRMFREMNENAAKASLPDVRSIRGRAWTDSSRASRNSRRWLYFLFVDNPEERVQIRIGESGHGAFDRGTVYRVYYYEDSGAAVFLSAETA